MPPFLRWDKLLLALGFVASCFFLFNRFHDDISTTHTVIEISQDNLITDSLPEDPEARAEYVKDAFQHAWRGYDRYAFPHNDLKPLSKSFNDTECAWGTTAIEALTTAIIMNKTEIVQQIVHLIAHNQWEGSNHTVSVLHSTTRHIGSMLSAYDLLRYERPDILREDQPVSILRYQAQSLANWLSFSFDTPHRLPANLVRLSPNRTQVYADWTDISNAGSLMLEWSHLTNISADYQYSHRVEAAMDKIFEASRDVQPKPFPGLIGQNIDLKSGRFMDAIGAWHDGAGTFYEYLLKIYMYNPIKYARYGELWKLAADATMKHLVTHPSTRPDLTFLAAHEGQKLRYYSDHSAHFAAASFLLGGSIFEEQEYIDFGLELIDTQVKMHFETPTGLGCESFMWVPPRCVSEDDNMDDDDCVEAAQYGNQTSFYQRSGYYITDARARLRPEVLESLYYAYRITRDVRWQDKSFRLFTNMVKMGYVRTGGFATVENVMHVPGLNATDGRIDLMESHFMAETLKYAYMIHVEDGPWHVQADGKNQYVFNAESHPLRVQIQPSMADFVVS